MYVLKISKSINENLVFLLNIKKPDNTLTYLIMYGEELFQIVFEAETLVKLKNQCFILKRKDFLLLNMSLTVEFIFIILDLYKMFENNILFKRHVK